MSIFQYNIPEFNYDPAVNLTGNRNKEMQKRIDMLEFVLDQSDEMVFVADKNSRLVFTNKKACDFLGYRQDEMLSMQIADIAPHFSEEVYMQSPMEGHQMDGSLILEMYYKNKDQRSIPVKVKISPYLASDCYISFVARDISASKQIFDLLTHNEQQFVNLVENAPNIIVRYDLMHRCIYVNEAFERIIGYPRNNMMEKYVGDIGILSVEQKQLVKNNLCQVIESGKSMEFELVFAHAISGLPMHFQIAGVPEYNAYNLTSGVLFLFHDITQLKHIEAELVIAKDKAEESNRMKTSFLGIINHEIRTPLNAIIGFSQFLKNESIAEDARNEFIDLIDESGMTLIRIIEEVLELSKIASGQIQINPQKCNPYAIIVDQFLAIKLMLRLNPKEGIEVQLDSADGVIANIPLFSDVMLVKKVLKILTDNAIKYTKMGHIVLGVSIAENEKIIFYVSDTGIGIPNEKHESIFEPFVQVDNSMMRPYDGLGIGLTLARRIARALDGDLTVDSIPGKGSSFFFSLPLSRIPD